MRLPHVRPFAMVDGPMIFEKWGFACTACSVADAACPLGFRMDAPGPRCAHGGTRVGAARGRISRNQIAAASVGHLAYQRATGRDE